VREQEGNSIVVHGGTKGRYSVIGNSISGLCGCALIKLVFVDHRVLFNFAIVFLYLLGHNRIRSRSLSLLISENILMQRRTLRIMALALSQSRILSRSQRFSMLYAKCH